MGAISIGRMDMSRKAFGVTDIIDKTSKPRSLKPKSEKGCPHIELSDRRSSFDTVGEGRTVRAAPGRRFDQLE